MSSSRKDKIEEYPKVITDNGSKRNYRRADFLGKGAFAKCFKVIDMVENKSYATKIITKELLNKNSLREKIVQEIAIHRVLQHEHVVQFHHFFEDQKYIYIILELCSRRSMAELQKRRRGLTEPEVRYYMKQLLSAVEYFHFNKIIHRDLKLGNLFLNAEMQLKVGDFGLATQLTDENERRKTLCGTPNYIAPEILEKRGHGVQVDIWSVGCILFTLLAGYPPFETQTLKDTYTRIRRCQYSFPPIFDKDAANLIGNILVKDPSKRPTASGILQHKFFTEGYTPSALPPSCLVMAPKFIAKKQPLLEQNSAASFNEVSVKKSAENFPSLDCYDCIKGLIELIIAVLNSKPSTREEVNEEEAEDPAAQPVMWISSWVDYSDKYGFGYKLSDHSIGVLFVDGTKLILLADGEQLHYTDKNGVEHYYTMQSFDPGLQKKVKLLTLFRRYMGMLIMTGAEITKQDIDCVSRLPVLCDWVRYENSIVMLLSNGTLQINFFFDHSKIIFCPLMGAVTYVDKNKTFRTYRLELIKEHGCSETLVWKLTYALNKIKQIVTERVIRYGIDT